MELSGQSCGYLYGAVAQARARVAVLLGLGQGVAHVGAADEQRRRVPFGCPWS